MIEIKKELKLITYDISPNHNEPVHISISKEKNNVINRIEELGNYILKHKDSLNEKETKKHIMNEFETIMKLKDKNTGVGIIDMMSFVFRMYFITRHSCKPLNIMNQEKGK